MNLKTFIKIENGDLFEGTRGQFMDCFFNNATDEQITDWCKVNDWKLEIDGKTIDESTSSKENTIIQTFADDMISELQKNNHKGSILEFTNFESIITELEYHKAKLFLAIRAKNKGAIREYLADTGNFLVAIGNVFDVFSDEKNENECFEINKDVDLFITKTISEQSKNQKLGK